MQQLQFNNELAKAQKKHSVDDDELESLLDQITDITDVMRNKNNIAKTKNT